MERPPRQPLKDARRAGLFAGRARRLAQEDASAPGGGRSRGGVGGGRSRGGAGLRGREDASAPGGSPRRGGVGGLRVPRTITRWRSATGKTRRGGVGGFRVPGPLDLEAVEGHRLDIAPARREGPQRQASRGDPFGGHRPVQERHRHQPRPRAGREAHGQSVATLGGRRLRRRALRPAAGPQQGDAFSVQPDVDLLRLVAAPVSAQLDAQLVVAVAGEVMPHRGAAARPERQVLAHPPVLRQQRRHRIAHDVGLDRGVGDREAADRARGGQVAGEQPRRHGQDVGVVVEAEREIVGRQQGLPVDVEMQQVAHRVLVLQPVEPVDRRPPRIGMVGRPLVERPFEPRAEGVVDRRRGARAPRGRHRPRAQLPQHLLPPLGLPPDLREIDRIEGETPGQRPLVVAGDAVAVEHLPVDGRLGRGPAARRRRRPARRLRERAGGADENGPQRQRRHAAREPRRATRARHRRHRRLPHFRLRPSASSPSIVRCATCGSFADAELLRPKQTAIATERGHSAGTKRANRRVQSVAPTTRMFMQPYSSPPISAAQMASG